jgi:hypothetical protein
MRGAGQLQVVVEHAEQGVAVEVDARDVVVDRRVGDGEPEPQPPVLGLQPAQVGGVLAALQARDLARGDPHVGSTRLSRARFVPRRYAARNASRAAASVASTCVASCADDTKPAS